MFYKWIGTLLLVGCHLPLFAQITGTITDVNTGDPIPSAVLQWEGTEVKVLSDVNGHYTINKVNGATILSVTATDYQTTRRSVISRAGTVNFALKSANEIEEVTITGEARATGVNSRSNRFQVDITQSELRKAACCNLSESFETNASVDVSYTDAVTGTRQIEMLGLSGKYILIQRENIPFGRGLNSSSGLTFIPGPFIQSIQLTKGLSSVVNGYESISGQINVEFMHPDEPLSLSVNGFVNQGARLESNVWVGTKVSERVQMGTLLHYSNVPFAQDKNNDGFADMPTGQQFNLHNRWKYVLNKNWGGQIGLSVTDDQRESGQTWNVWESDVADPWLFEQNNTRYELFGKNGWISSDDPDRSVGIIYGANYQERSATLGKALTTGEQTSAYLNVIFQNGFGEPGEHSVKTGLSFQYDDVMENLDSNGLGVDYLLSRKEAVPGAFAEYTFNHGPVTLVAGLRADYNSLFNWIITPRVNVKYEPWTGTVFRISGGRGQRTANAITENINGLASGRTFRIIGDAIEREIAWNFGASVSQDFLLFGRGASLSADAFFTYFNQKLIGDFDRVYREYNVYYTEGSQSTSLLVQLDVEPLENFEVRVAYKYLNSLENFTLGTFNAYGVPKHRGFINLAYNWEEHGWKFDATYNVYGPKRLLSTKFYNVDLPDESPTFSTVNLQVNKELGKHWEAYAGVDNLLNYKQDNPILNAENPYSRSFETNRVYGPIFGRMIYAGFYYNL